MASRTQLPGGMPLSTSRWSSCGGPLRISRPSPICFVWSIRTSRAGSALPPPASAELPDGDEARASVPVLVPGALEHLLAADHPARVTGQALQDGELLGGNGDLVSIHADLVRAQVYGERAVLQHLGLAGGLLAAA